MGSDRKPTAFELDKLKTRGGGALRHWFECLVSRCNPSRRNDIKSIDELFSMAQVKDEGTLSSVSLYPFFKIEGGETTWNGISYSHV